LQLTGKTTIMIYSFQGELMIPFGNQTLRGDLVIPLHAGAIIIFSHGSGGGRFSRRNQLVAKYLQSNKMGTFMPDLLSDEEDMHYNNRFNIEMLAKRLAGATEWLERFPAAMDCRIGYFSTGTGTAAALKAASMLPCIQAIVSRGGRPELANDALQKVIAPTLLIVGSLDFDVLQVNRAAYNMLICAKRLEVLEGATHLFEEQGKMEMVSELTANWFNTYLLPVHA
jgi:hypothetical protein